MRIAIKFVAFIIVVYNLPKNSLCKEVFTNEAILHKTYEANSFGRCHNKNKQQSFSLLIFLSHFNLTFISIGFHIRLVERFLLYQRVRLIRFDLANSCWNDNSNW